MIAVICQPNTHGSVFSCSHRVYQISTRTFQQVLNFYRTLGEMDTRTQTLLPYSMHCSFGISIACSSILRVPTWIPFWWRKLNLIKFSSSPFVVGVVLLVLLVVSLSTFCKYYSCRGAQQHNHFDQLKYFIRFMVECQKSKESDDEIPLDTTGSEQCCFYGSIKMARLRTNPIRFMWWLTQIPQLDNNAHIASLRPIVYISNASKFHDLNVMKIVCWRCEPLIL